MNLIPAQDPGDPGQGRQSLKSPEGKEDAYKSFASSHQASSSYSG